MPLSSGKKGGRSVGILRPFYSTMGRLQTDSGAHPAFYSVTGVLLWGQRKGSVKTTVHLHLMQPVYEWLRHLHCHIWLHGVEVNLTQQQVPLKQTKFNREKEEEDEEEAAEAAQAGAAAAAATTTGMGGVVTL